MTSKDKRGEFAAALGEAFEAGRGAQRLYPRHEIAKTPNPDSEESEDSVEHRGRLTDNDLERIVELARGSDSVELKLTVPSGTRTTVGAALGVDPLDAEIRQVFFFDTPELALNRAGIVARARRVQGRSGDTVVKRRPVVPDDLPEEFRQSPSTQVEVDLMPGNYVCSASLKGRANNEKIRRVAAGDGRIAKLFTKEQRRFFRSHSPEGIELDGLSILGPIFVLKVKVMPKDYARRLVGEMWLYPDNSMVLELSTKCAPPEMLDAIRETREFLTQGGVDLDAEQQTKTRTALEFFAARL